MNLKDVCWIKYVNGGSSAWYWAWKCVDVIMWILRATNKIALAVGWIAIMFILLSTVSAAVISNSDLKYPPVPEYNSTGQIIPLNELGFTSKDVPSDCHVVGAYTIQFVGFEHDKGRGWWDWILIEIGNHDERKCQYMLSGSYDEFCAYFDIFSKTEVS